MLYRIIAGMIGSLFLLQSVNWIIDAASAAEALGMPLLDELGRSTQVGDIAGFFLALGSLCLLGAVRSSAILIRCGALLLACAAIMRTLAWAFQDAAFASQFIGIEIVLAGLLLFIASRFEAGTAPAVGEDS